MTIYEIRTAIAETRKALMEASQEWRGTPRGNAFIRMDQTAFYMVQALFVGDDAYIVLLWAGFRVEDWELLEIEKTLESQRE